MKQGRCCGCGINFSRRARGRNDTYRYCSRECAYEHDAHYRGRRELKESRAISDGIMWWASHWNKCRVCGCDFVGKTNASAVCSNECKRHELNAQAAKVNEIKRASRPCKRCGTTVTRTAHKTAKHGTRLMTICDQCRTEVNRLQKRKTKALRRARKKNNGPHEPINPFEVFSRDQYLCGLCGKSTCKDECVPHPRAPTLDHIIPLAKGGTHTLGNVQCACFECNWMKADKT